LVDWVEHRSSFFLVRGWSRRHQAPYELSREGDALHLAKAVLPDLLTHFVTNVAPGSEVAARDLVDSQLAHLRAEALAG
jgi:hypothetical protein